MTKLLLVLFSIFVLFITIFFILICKEKYVLSSKQRSFIPFITPLKKEKHNPDINTKNWDLHKIRLNKFGRSQYKGLTFFISSEDRIYYLSEKGSKVYC